MKKIAAFAIPLLLVSIFSLSSFSVLRASIIMPGTLCSDGSTPDADGNCPGVNQNTTPGQNQGVTPGVNQSPSPSTAGGSAQIPNPLGAQTSLCALITKIINLVAELGAIVAVLFLLFAGFQFIRAQGNPAKIEEAKRTFFYTLIGIAILLGAYVITQIIWGTINAIIPLPGGTCT